jgi:hypothetical protein
MPYKTKRGCTLCGKTDFVNLSSHMRHVHGKTVLASGTSGHKKRLIANINANIDEPSNLVTVRDKSSDPLRFQATNVINNVERHDFPKGLNREHATDGIQLQLQNTSYNNNVPFEETEDSEVSKERLRKVHFAMLEPYYKLPIHKKQKYLMNESSRAFLIFLQELCLNAMRRSFEFDKEELLALNCERSYLKSISGLLPTKQLRKLLSSDKMVKAIDSLIPFALKWWTSFN